MNDLEKTIGHVRILVISNMRYISDEQYDMDIVQNANYFRLQHIALYGHASETFFSFQRNWKKHATHEQR